MRGNESQGAVDVLAIPPHTWHVPGRQKGECANADETEIVRLPIACGCLVGCEPLKAAIESRLAFGSDLPVAPLECRLA